MGIFFQPDMTKAKELSAAATRHVLRTGNRDVNATPELSDTVPVDFLRSLKELQRTGSVLKA